MNLVDAQQARRVLDRLVGYKISPILCKKIQNKLSAGRVQSVTLRLVVDREREILNFKPEEYWTLQVILSKIDGSKETYQIPEGTQTGTKFTIRGKGFKTVNASSQGNFVFTVQVQVPKHLTKEQRDLLTQLAKTMNEQPPVKKKGIFGF